MTTAQKNGTSDRAAIEAATHSATDRPAIETIELANRVVLRVRPVASFLLREAARAVPEPQPPRVWIASRGTDRDDPADPGWEENPDSPSFKQRYAEYLIDSDLASLKVALIMGTTIEYLPDGIWPPSNEKWIKEIEDAASFADITPPVIRREPEKARYLDWLRFYAVPSEDDIFRLTRLVTSGTLVTEEALADSLASFRRRKVWAADLANALVGRDRNRNHDAADPAGDGS